MALYLFVAAGLFSPGPNVIMLTASGARFGFRRTLPHLLGVPVGVGITAGVTGLGLGTLLLAAPVLTVILKIISAAWILWLAWTLFTATRVDAAQAHNKPFTFIEAVLFQWVNPKVWAVAVAAMAFVADDPPTVAGATLALTFSAINLGVCLFWTSTGHLLGRLLAQERLWRIFMTVMAVLMAVSAGLIFV